MKTIVLVHGALIDGRLWAPLRVALEGADARFVSIELRELGYHLRSTSTPQVEANLGERLDGLRPPGDLILVGHSFGAWLAARALARSKGVDRAILVGGMVPSSPELVAPQGALADALEAGGVTADEVVAQLLALAWGVDVPPDRRRVLEEMVLREPREMACILRRVAELGHPDHLVRPFATPTTVIHGGEDHVVPVDEARELAGLGTATRLVIVPGAGHMLPLEDPELLAREIGGG